MAGAAGGPAGFILVVIGIGRQFGVVLSLHSCRRRAVAGGAGADIADTSAELRPDDLPVKYGLVKTDNAVIATGDDAGQRGALMNLVYHHLKIGCVTGFGVGILRSMAGNAELGLDTRTAVNGQRVMALVAGCRGDYLSGQLYGAASRHEIKDRVRGESSGGAGSLPAYPV